MVGPVTADLAHANASARAALSAPGPRRLARRAAPGRAADDLLPERALAGDGHARRHLVDEVYRPLLAARGTLLETLSAYLEHGASIEATASGAVRAPQHRALPAAPDLRTLTGLVTDPPTRRVHAASSR